MKKKKIIVSNDDYLTTLSKQDLSNNEDNKICSLNNINLGNIVVKTEQVFNQENQYFEFLSHVPTTSSAQIVIDNNCEQKSFLTKMENDSQKRIFSSYLFNLQNL